MLTRLMDLVVLVAELSRIGEVGTQALGHELESRGFVPEEIEQAIYWYSSREMSTNVTPDPGRAVRVASDFERMSISADCQGYLLRLFNLGLIDIGEFDYIISRAIPVGPEKVHLGDVKAIASEIIFDHPHRADRGVEEGLLDFATDAPMT